MSGAGNSARERATLTLDVNLDTVINGTAIYVYDEEGGREFEGYEGGSTLGERAAELLAEKMFAEATSRARMASYEAQTALKQLVHEQVSVIVSDTLSEFVKTLVFPPDKYKKDAAPVSLTDLIVSIGETWVTSSYDNYGRDNNMQAAVKKAVDYTFRDELERAATKAKAQIVQTIQANAKATVDAALLKLGVTS